MVKPIVFSRAEHWLKKLKFDLPRYQQYVDELYGPLQYRSKRYFVFPNMRWSLMIDIDCFHSRDATVEIFIMQPFRILKHKNILTS